MFKVIGWCIGTLIAIIVNISLGLSIPDAGNRLALFVFSFFVGLILSSVGLIVGSILDKRI